MIGKRKCKILKEIRQRIADANDIEYVTRECEYQGECKGTCPRCESEVRYLEEQLEKRRQSGKKIAVAAVAAGVLLSATGCDFLKLPKDRDELPGDVPNPDYNYEEEPVLLEGDVPYIPEVEVTEGEPVADDLEYDEDECRPAYALREPTEAQ